MDDTERRVMRILRDALDLDLEERERYIAERCGDEHALLTRVKSLLAVADAEIRQQSAVTRDAGEAEDPLIGQLLGPFRVIERIGRGGMGVVYRGEREGSDFSQVVALKLIRRGFDFDDVQSRFLRERRILARLAHPNLARLVDGGRSSDGRPWFALEYIRGQPISTWCDSQRLSIRERVELMRGACEAVQYAHSQLVLHRDLKPANILVDTDGKVRLLDFGIAKLLDDEGDGSATTMSQRPALTPEYAAPEQLAGEPVGAGVDVYALGVVLYELLSGIRPYSIDRNNFDVAIKTARNTLPPTLVSAISKVSAEPEPDPAALQQRLDARKITLRAYRALVETDLQRITEKALAKEPERRYLSAQAFADDLQRWLRGEPVRVSGNSKWYLFRKFVQRNRLAVALSALFACVFLGGAASIAWKNRQIEAALIRATAVQNLLTGLFEASAPAGPTQDLPTVKELLEHGAKQIRSAAQNDPALQSELLVTLGNIFSAQSQFAEALALYEEALGLRERSEEKEGETLIVPLLRMANVQKELNRMPQARASLDRAGRLLQNASDEERFEWNLGECIVRFREMRWPETLAPCEEAVSRVEKLSKPDPSMLSAAYAAHAAALRYNDLTQEAVRVSERGVKRIRELRGGDHFDQLYIYSGLVLSLNDAGLNQQAARFAREAIEIAEKVLPANHPEKAVQQLGYGNALIGLGQPAEAEAAYREGLRGFIAVYGPKLTLSTPEMYYTRLNLARAVREQRRYEETDSLLDGLLRDVLESEDLREQKRTIARVQNARATSFIAQNRLDEAETLLTASRESLKDSAEKVGDDLQVVLQRLLGDIALKRYETRLALTHFNNALRLLGDPSESPRDAALLWRQISEAWRIQGDVPSAVDSSKKALNALQGQVDARHPLMISVRLELAKALKASGDNAGFLAELQTLQSAASELPTDDPLRAEAEGLKPSP